MLARDALRLLHTLGPMNYLAWLKLNTDLSKLVLPAYVIAELRRFGGAGG